LQELIDAAENDFDDVRGDFKRSSSSSDTYTTTVVPDGMRRCTLFVPQRRRTPWVACWAPDDMSFRELVEKVADALGSAGTRDSDGQTWQVEGVEVQVDRGSSLTLDVRKRRE
jgi:hypothetical protein